MASGRTMAVARIGQMKRGKGVRKGSIVAV